MPTDHSSALEALEFRLNTLLPTEYQDCYEELQPVSMKSAGLKFDVAGRVAWNEIWGSFCDLAMAGGPPHKGVLLEPGTRAAVEAQSVRHREVTDEICRGITMVTGLHAIPSPHPGWVRVSCHDRAMAGWLLRAIVMENVAARCDGAYLDLPAAPSFRLDKEIKNVVTVIAKTCHYWVGHMPPEQHDAIAAMLATMDEDTPLIEPAFSVDGARLDGAGWRGVECASAGEAIWLMRALVVNNILSRRERMTLFVPVNAESDPGGEAVAGCLARVRALAASIPASVAPKK